MFSSKSDEWATPQDLFDRLNAVYNFDLDPCATPENAKCSLYYTKSDNGLEKSWGGALRFCQSSIRQGDREMGEESMGRKSKTENKGCYVVACPHRYSMVSRLHISASGNNLYPRAAAFWRADERCAVSVNDCYFRQGGRY